MKRRTNRTIDSLEENHERYNGNERKDFKFRGATNITFTILKAVIISAVAVAILHLTISKRTSRNRTKTINGPPPGVLVIPTKREHFTPVPEMFKRTFVVYSSNEGRLPIIRALRSLGWKMISNPEQAHLIWEKFVQPNRFAALHPWQRYNHIPNFQTWDRKDRFALGFQRYKIQNPNKKLYFLPETYILGTQEGQFAFEQRLSNGGLALPWVLKVPSVNNGKGIQMLGGNSRALQGIVHRVRSEMHALSGNSTFVQVAPTSDKAVGDEDKPMRWKNSKGTKKKFHNYIIQRFICNELTWHENRKFDFRMWWMVPSIDPLIVLYADGYARIGSSIYDESDFSDTKKHLTTMTNTDGELKGTMDEVKDLIRDHYHRNYLTLSKRFKGDPYQHVRNQMMEAISETVAAFKDTTFGNFKEIPSNAENSFSLYGADFVLDNNLDVWYLESQAGPGYIEDFDFRVTMHRQYLRTLFTVMEEIQEKIEANPRASVLPLTSDIEGWDIVYAGDWMYQYSDYDRQPSTEQCSLSHINPKDPSGHMGNSH